MTASPRVHKAMAPTAIAMARRDFRRGQARLEPKQHDGRCGKSCVVGAGGAVEACLDPGLLVVSALVEDHDVLTATDDVTSVDVAAVAASSSSYLVSCRTIGRVEDIIGDTSEQPVAPASSPERVVAVVPVEDVRLCPSEERVVAGVPTEEIGSREPLDVVGVTEATDRIGPPGSGECVGLLGAAGRTAALPDRQAVSCARRDVGHTKQASGDLGLPVPTTGRSYLDSINDHSANPGAGTMHGIYQGAIAQRLYNLMRNQDPF